MRRAQPQQRRERVLDRFTVGHENRAGTAASSTLFAEDITRADLIENETQYTTARLLLEIRPVWLRGGQMAARG